MESTMSRVKTQLTMLRFNGLVNRIGGQQMRANLFWFSDGQWARIEPVYSKQSPWREAEEQSAHFERDHACAQERMSMGRLSAGIWAGQDGLQSLQPLECAGNLAEHLRGGGRTC